MYMYMYMYICMYDEISISKYEFKKNGKNGEKKTG